LSKHLVQRENTSLCFLSIQGIFLFIPCSKSTPSQRHLSTTSHEVFHNSRKNEKCLKEKAKIKVGLGDK